jgi:hypothetical protein
VLSTIILTLSSNDTMHAIFLAWKNSLDLLRPHRLASLLVSCFTIFIKGSIAFGRSFLPFLLCDAILFLCFGNYIAKIINAYPAVTPGILSIISLIIIIFAQAITWFLTTTSFILLLRREEHVPDHAYYAAFILKYCQLALAGTVVFLFGAQILYHGFHLTTIPSINWYFVVFLRTFEFSVTLYWLDARPASIKNMLGAVEHAANFFFYNAPIIGLLILLTCGIDYGWSTLANKWLNMPNQHLFFASSHTFLTPMTETITNRCLVLAVKYGTFLIEAIMATFLIAIYRRKRHEQYSDSLFL